MEEEKVDISGRFSVAGILQFDGIGSFIYGDVAEGTVEKGGTIRVPLNSQTVLEFQIQEIEMMDLRSERKAHVALLLETVENETETHEMLEILNIIGDTLEVSSLT